MLSSNEETISTSDVSSLSLDHPDDPTDSHEKDESFLIEQNDRINTLKNLQILYNQCESHYLKCVYELEYKFHQQCSHLFDRRAMIINGKYEPTDDECRLKTDSIESIERTNDENETRGIPSFWLQTLKQIPLIADTIEEWDEPILKSLQDIRFQLHLEPIVGFTLEFHFDSNAKNYFQNDFLTKFYEVQIESEQEFLFYEGTAIVRSVGCQIDWLNSTTNVTRNRQTGEEQPSFFHFFTPPTSSTADQIDDLKLATDFQIGYYIRENLVPKAILYYTGEIFDDEEDEEDEDENDDDEDDEDFSDDQMYSMTEETGDGEHL